MYHCCSKYFVSFFKYLELYLVQYYLMKKILLFILLIASFSSQAQTTHTVTNTNDAGVGSLRAAADSTVAGDTIRFASSLIASGSDSIVLTTGEISFGNKGITIKGVYNITDTLFISGNNNSRIFSFDEAGRVSLDSLVLINGNGLGINSSSKQGGAIYIRNCTDTLFVVNSTISGNSIIPVNSNTSGGWGDDGGGIYSFNSPLSLINSTISGNTARGGGGIFSTSSVSITNSNILGNSAFTGGGVCSIISPIRILNSTISGNTATMSGGGIHSSSVSITNSTISGNSAYAGGGICSDPSYFSDSCSIMILSSTISGNSAYSTSGGGIYSSSFVYSSIMVKSSTISGNTAINAGGGIFSFSSLFSSVSIINSSILGNSLSAHYSTGGGICSQSAPTASSPSSSSYSSLVSIINTTISGNSAFDGGGVYSFSKSHSFSFPSSSSSSSSVSITSSTISGNTAIRTGGGIYCYSITGSSSFPVSSSVNVTNSTVSGNTASITGGGVMSYCILPASNLNSSATVMVTNSTIAGNIASLGEGIYCQSYGTSISQSFGLPNSSVITITSSIVTENGSNGSGIFSSHPPTITSNGYNIFSDIPTGVIGTDSTNITTAQLNLQVLAFNGGSTQTMLPAVGSIALDHGNPNDSSDAQNAPIVGTRNVGAAESCYASPSSINVTECSFYTVPSGNLSYTQSGIYKDTIITTCGADSVITINLTINSTTSIITEMACDSYTSPSGNYVWTSSNTYKDTIPNAVNCDSIITINLIINSTTAIITETACNSYTSPSGNYIWTSSNTYMDTIPNASNCDSIITIILTVNYPSTATVTVTACDSYTSPSGNYVWTSSNTYMDTIPNAANCDSIITINLTIKNFTTSTINETACNSYTSPSGNYVWTSSNTYLDTIPNAANCDSILIINLIINNSSQSTDILTACDSLLWIDGVTYTASNNTATYTLTNTLGCDSVVTLDLTIHNSSTGTDVLTACDSVIWIDGVTYTASNNTATYTLTNTLGCDSVVTLDLTITNSTTGTDVLTACDSLTWIDGVTYTGSNNAATYTLTNTLGCDSVVTLDLTITNSTTGTDVLTACDSSTWIDGVTYTASNNTVTYTLTNTLGCDSVVTLDLTIHNSNTQTDVITACDSLTWIDGVTYTASNNAVTYTLTNTLGCDSVVTLDLTIHNSTTGTDVITGCDSLTWIDGVTYTASNNTATFTLTNTLGCDSVVTLDLTIHYSSMGIDVITACDRLTWINGITYYSDNNTAIDTIMNSLGCDSIVTLNLTIQTIDSTVIQSNDTLTAVEIGASYQWMDCTTNTLINGAVSQQFVPTVTGTYRVEITKGLCVDSSACFQVIVCVNEALYSVINNGAGNFDFTDVSLGSYTQTHWSFGDGVTSILSNPNHVYQANGNYVVVLTINDSLASNICMSYFMDTISVTGVGSSLVCQAGFSVYFDTTAGTVNVVNSSMGNNLSYSWDFGDGASSTQQFPTHSYASNGPFNLCLTIDDGNGCVDTYCDSISSQGIWFRTSGFDLHVEGAEPNSMTNVELTQNLNIYPNPVQDEVHIEMTNWLTNGVNIIVRDITGKLIFTQEVAPVSNQETISINTSKWAKGTYFIEVGDGVNVVIEKMVVQ